MYYEHLQRKLILQHHHDLTCSFRTWKGSTAAPLLLRSPGCSPPSHCAWGTPEHTTPPTPLRGCAIGFLLPSVSPGYPNTRSRWGKRLKRGTPHSKLGQETSTWSWVILKTNTDASSSVGSQFWISGLFCVVVGRRIKGSFCVLPITVMCHTLTYEARLVNPSTARRPPLWAGLSPSPGRAALRERRPSARRGSAAARAERKAPAASQRQQGSLLPVIKPGQFQHPPTGASLRGGRDGNQTAPWSEPPAPRFPPQRCRPRRGGRPAGRRGARTGRSPAPPLGGACSPTARRAPPGPPVSAPGRSAPRLGTGRPRSRSLIPAKAHPSGRPLCRVPAGAGAGRRGWPAPSPTARRPAAPPRAPATSRRAPGPPQRLGPSRRAEGGAGEAAGPGRAVPQGHGDNSAPWRPGPLMAAGRRCAAAVAPRAGPRLCKEEISSSSPSRGAAAFWFSFNPGMIYLLHWCGALIPVGAFVHRCETNRYGLAELPRPCAHRGGMASFWALGGLQQVERRETKRGQGHERWRDVSFPPACSASSFRRPAPWEHALLFPIY